MKLIIDISEGSYNTIKECYERGELLTTICMQIATGTPYEERPNGEWEDMSWFYHKPMYKCTRCNQILEIGYYSYCPYCGAYMRGEENE